MNINTSISMSAINSGSSSRRAVARGANIVISALNTGINISEVYDSALDIYSLGKSVQGSIDLYKSKSK